MVPARHSDEIRSIERARLDLIRRMADGDQEALGQLYDSTNRLVFGLIQRILGDPASAEEVTLEVYTQVWRQAPNYDPRRGTPSAWMLTIARSRAIDRLRSTEQTRRRQEPLDTVDTARATGRNPEESASEAERREVVTRALAELPDEQRQVIELAYYGGYSHSEIAAKLSLPLGTVKTRTRLAMGRLRESLSSFEGELA